VAPEASYMDTCCGHGTTISPPPPRVSCHHPAHPSPLAVTSGISRAGPGP
jgi:hypothetical protein